MYVYYRATDTLEYNSLFNLDQLPSEHGVTYWTDGLSPARWYQGVGRKIVRITLDRELPKHFFGIAEGVDDRGNINNHREWVMPKGEFNEFIGKHLHDVELID